MWPFPPESEVLRSLRQRIGELEAEVALAKRDAELLGACNDRLRADLEQEHKRLMQVSASEAEATTHIAHLLLAHWAKTPKAELS